MSIVEKIRNVITGNIENRLEKCQAVQTELAMQNGRILSSLQAEQLEKLSDAEFKVFSQWGEDGIIQWLIKRIPIKNKTFIEFGASDYEEANTRFLLMNNNWSGYILDGDKKSINHIINSSYYWKYDLVAKNAFISQENIEELLHQSGFDSDLGLLSIDIDGVDWWVLRKIEYYKPRILICEYNDVFGKEEKVTVPYSIDFYRTNMHYSNLYWGASIQAFISLGDEKGYKFIGTNSAGNNAFFVREDMFGYVKDHISNITISEVKYRESRDSDGKLTYLRDREKKVLEIEDMEVYNIKEEKICKIRELITE